MLVKSLAIDRYYNNSYWTYKFSNVIGDPIIEKVINFNDQNTDFISNGITSHDQFPSVTDGDPVALSFNNFFVQKGHLVTTSNRCKGLYLHIKKDLIIDGTLSMTARGANAYGRYVCIDPISKQIIFIYNNVDENLVKNEFDVSRIIYPTGGTSGNGNPGVNGACGGGGGYTVNGNNKIKGGNGTSFSGGAGGGGVYFSVYYNAYYSASSTNGSNNGGPGGKGYCAEQTNHPHVSGGGGAGNPGGTRWNNSNQAESGTGGLLILIVDGDIKINGNITSHGSAGSKSANSQLVNNYMVYLSGGSGSGGGAVHIFHKGNIIGSDNITVTGGTGAPAADGTNAKYNSPGSNGGDGSINIQKI